MTTEAATPAARPDAAAQTLADRLLAALPLAGSFLALFTLYGWEAWRHRTPWLFVDEYEMAALARSFAHTGHTLLHGKPYSFHSLYTIVTSPAWLLSPVSRAYAAAKYLGVFLMTLTLLPTYFLARMVTTARWPALVAAIGATSIPPLVYSSYLTPESIAYPWTAFCFLLIAKALVTRGRGWIAGAVVASLVAPLVRGQLAMVIATFVLAALFVLWSSEAGRRWRSRWRAGDWLGWAMLVIGAGIVAGGFASQFSQEYQIMTLYYHGLIGAHALKAAGALTIGVGLLPLVAAVAVLFRAPGERPSRELRTLRALLVASALAFGMYTGVKGAWNQYSFGTRVWERNIMYLAPLWFVALAVWLERRRLNRWGALAGLALVAYLLARTPYLMQFRFSSDSPGVAILAQMNRSLSFTPTDARIVLYVLLAVVALLLALPELPHLPRHVPLAAAAVAAGLVLAWNVAGEVSASAATTAFSDSFMANIRRPPDWLEQHTRGARTVYLGQQIADPNSDFLLLFWNPSVTDVWSLDGTADALRPGFTMTPDVRGTDGVLLNGLHQPISDDVYAVVDPGIDIAGTLVARHAHSAGGGTQYWRLIKVDQPIRLLGSLTGVYLDRWSDPKGSAYTRYGGPPGRLRVLVSWREVSGEPRPSHATIRLGTLGIGPDRQPRIARVTRTIRWTIHAHTARAFVLTPPGRAFRVEVTVDPPYVPAETPGANSSDRRALGAVLTYRFVPRNAAQR